MALPRQQQPPTRRGLLPEAKRLVLPDGIVSTGAPRRIAVAKKLGLGLDPWQVDISRILWAQTADGCLANDTVCMSIPRQSGKTYTVAVNVFAECLITPGTTVVWTAHHGFVMRETFTQLAALAETPALQPHIKPGRAGVKRGAEERSINFRNGSRIVMAARESGALRGVSKVRILVLDEAQILSEAAMADMVPTQNQAPGGVLVIMMGTPPKPSDDSEVWSNQRSEAVSAEKAGRLLELATWIEFSADSDAETDDKAQWRQANPSYPKRTPLRAIRKLRRLLTEDHFRREALGIWDDLSTPAVIQPGIWGTLGDAESKPVRKLVLGVDVSPDREVASVALAGWRADGLVHVELYESRAGVSWLVNWLAARCEVNPITTVVIDAKSPAATLIPALRRAHVRVVTTNTDDMANACAGFYDACMDGVLRHIDQVQLTRSLNSARKRSIGDRWAWNRKTADADITPIVAATVAVWAVLSRRVRDKEANTRKGMVLSW